MTTPSDTSPIDTTGPGPQEPPDQPVGPEGSATSPGYAEWMAQWGADTPEGSATSWLGLAGLGAVLALIGFTFSWYIVIAILAIVVSVILHEAGHFIAAKRSGMKVTEAFVGFGPRLWSFRRGETEYGIKAIWAGAYVRIIGMHNLEDVHEADEEKTYRSKSYPRRLVTILAGPGMNILLAWVIFSGLLLANGRIDDTVWPIEQVVSGSAAEAAGLQPGDQIVALNGVSLATYEDFKAQIPGLSSTEVELTFRRDDQLRTVRTNLGWRLASGAAAVVPELRTGDLVDSVEGVAPTSFADFRERVAAPGSHVIKVDRNWYGYEITVDGPRQIPADAFTGFLGIRPVSPSDLPREEFGLPSAMATAAADMGTMMGQVGAGFRRFLSPSGLQNYGSQVVEAVPGAPNAPANVKELGVLEGAPPDVRPPGDEPEDRPISIIGGTKLLGDGLETGGLVVFFGFLGMINLSLGVLNLMPLLPFDGGHAAVATYERLRSRRGREYRVDMSKLLPVTYAVVILFVLFGLSSMFLDIRNPVQLP